MASWCAAPENRAFKSRLSKKASNINSVNCRPIFRAPFSLIKISVLRPSRRTVIAPNIEPRRRVQLKSNRSTEMTLNRVVVYSWKIWCGTVWKFQYFCITEILREILLEYSRSAKSAVLATLGAVNFVHLVNFSLQKVQKFIKSKFKPSKYAKMTNLAKFDFT